MSPLSMKQFRVETYNHEQPLTAIANVYVDTSRQRSTAGTILLFAHGTGYHKEIWEPTIKHIFSLDKDRIVREAWAVDCQNHGESAAVNEKILVDHPGILDIWDYSDSLASVYRQFISPTITMKNRVILIAHSAGSAGAILSTQWFNPPSKIPFNALILVEPPIFPKEMFAIHETPVYKAISSMTPLRRENWDSREAAQAWMAKRLPWSMWDPEVLEKYVKYGLRKLPTMLHPHKQGVTLACNREDETRAYVAGTYEFSPLWRLNQLCEIIPVHVIWGANDDLFSSELKATIADPTQGRTIASVRRIEDAGHLVVQEKPRMLAQALLDIMRLASSHTSKL